MFFWIIPYLVAYNVSESNDWKYGPIHQFESKVKANLITDNNREIHSEFTMFFACKPINSSFVSCRVENSTLENYDGSSINSTSSELDDGSDLQEYVGDLLFHVEFNKTGVTNVLFPKPRGYFIENIIRSIIGNFHVGIDLTSKKLGRYVSMDKSINGICETSFEIGKIPRREMEEKMEENSAVTNMTINSLGINLSESESFVIEKKRNMYKCVKKTPYLFGSDEEIISNEKKGIKIEVDFTSSRQEIYLGKNRFNSYNENMGMIKTRIRTPQSYGGKMMSGKISESIRLTLIAVVQATEEYI